jgi:lipopolysaccharide transport system ATP-binding protein
MPDVILSVDNISKRYLVGHRSQGQERYKTLRDLISRETRNVARKAVDFVRGRQILQGDEVEEFWALRNISFEVKRGEVLGIIGRNGAGKSTLLKILSRITEPDGGRAILRGRVASLLEVATGFHPELTGRENIFLNGAILGMPRAEIARKFDEIVDFAEVARFLDTPVKRYSSGMYVRLAFAVAAHLEPEILLVDEVLAVGDAEFQKKCLGKMGEVARHGRTILLVSHNMAAIESMCGSAVLLAEGRNVASGTTPRVVQEYLRKVASVSAAPLEQRTDREGSGNIRFSSLSLQRPDGTDVSAFHCGSEAVLSLTIENCVGRALTGVRIAIGIDNELGQRVAHLDSDLHGPNIIELPPGVGHVKVIIPKMQLFPGCYRLTLFATVKGMISDWIQDAAQFDVESGDYYGFGQLPLPAQAVFLAEHRFVCRGIGLNKD